MLFAQVVQKVDSDLNVVRCKRRNIYLDAIPDQPLPRHVLLLSFFTPCDVPLLSSIPIH